MCRQSLKLFLKYYDDILNETENLSTLMALVNVIIFFKVFFNKAPLIFDFINNCDNKKSMQLHLPPETKDQRGSAAFQASFHHGRSKALSSKLPKTQNNK